VDVSREIAACIARFWKARGVDPTLDALLVYVFVFTCADGGGPVLTASILILASCGHSGADDLLPIMCYVTVQANPPHFVSQTYALIDHRPCIASPPLTGGALTSIVLCQAGPT